MKRALRRATVTFGAVLTAQLLLLAALTSALGVEIAFFDTALLTGATTLLGHVWALRQHLSRTGRPAVLAGLLPFVATTLFLTPVLAGGAPPDALLTIASCAALISPTGRAWSEWICDRPPSALSYGLSTAGPTIAVALAVLAIDSSAALAGIALVSIACSALLGGWVARRAARSESDARRFVRHLQGVEVHADALAIPASPDVHDPWLVELDGNLRKRSQELAEDAEEARHAEVAIEDARQLRSRFMASMSHELRSPLNSIVGFGQILEDGLDGALTPGQLESVVMIKRAAEELIRLLTDTLDLARLEAGKLRLRQEWIPSVEILTEAVRRGRAIVEGKDVEIQAELQPGLPPVYADPQRIVQAVVALFRHAAASMEVGTVRLRARTALGPPGPPFQLRVEFYDAVGALPREEVERIFEAFREIVAPEGRRVGGLGMALSLSRSLVRLHGGDVWADGVPGAGTILCVALPLDDPRPAP